MNGTQDNTMESEPAREAGWIRAIAGGDREAFKRLYGAYRMRLFRFLLRLAGDAATAEELVNDVMITVWNDARRFRGDSKPSTWIFGIAHYKGLYARRRARVTLPIEAAPEPIAGENDTPEQALEAAKRRRRIQSALVRLSAAHRAVIELVFYQGFSYGEVAAILGCPENTVKTRMYHARRALKSELAGVEEGA